MEGWREAEGEREVEGDGGREAEGGRWRECGGLANDLEQIEALHAPHVDACLRPLCEGPKRTELQRQ